MKHLLLGIVVVGFLGVGSQADAKFCDYRLSQLIGSGGAAAAVGASTVVAGGGTAMKAAGFYLITNATTGAAMIGSTAAGASAAGTVGIIGGSAAAGGVVAFLTAPITVTIAALTAVGAAAVEGGCYFMDERITDFDQVLSIVQEIGERTDRSEFEVFPTKSENHKYNDGTRRANAIIRVKNSEGAKDQYLVSNLYIVNGELKHRDWGRNTSIGYVTVAMEGLKDAN